MKQPHSDTSTTDGLVDWKQHKTGPHRRQGLGWRCSSARLRIANVIVRRTGCLVIHHYVHGHSRHTGQWVMNSCHILSTPPMLEMMVWWQTGADEVAPKSLPEIMKHSVAMLLVHLGVNIETWVAEFSDLLSQQLHSLCRVAEDDWLIDLQLYHTRHSLQQHHHRNPDTHYNNTTGTQTLITVPHHRNPDTQYNNTTTGTQTLITVPHHKNPNTHYNSTTGTQTLITTTPPQNPDTHYCTTPQEPRHSLQQPHHRNPYTHYNTTTEPRHSLQQHIRPQL